MASTCLAPRASLDAAMTPPDKRTPLQAFIVKYEPSSVDRLNKFHDDLELALVHVRAHGFKTNAEWESIKHEDRRTFDKGAR